jgi:acyl-CoA reductase-like NAD-dependent aldehyde dehydrogenase
MPSAPLPDTFLLSVDGQGLAGGEEFDVIDPATEELVARCPAADSSMLAAAVAAASRAFPAWRSTPWSERSAALKALGQLLQTHRDTLVTLLVREQGKPRLAAEWEIDSSAAWFAGIAEQALEDEERPMLPGMKSVLRHVPVGVVAAIVPWNFPILLAVWKIAPALLAGNTMVLKPSPYTPLTTLHFGRLAQSVLPAGVLNVLALPDSLAPQLTEHPDVGMIAFTGSTETGKRVTLELGGNDPAIVLPDADLEAAVPALFWAAFQNSAQFCVASKRLYVHESIYDRFCAALVAYARTVRVGNGLDPAVGLGPIQNRVQFNKVRDLIDESRRAGHRFLLGGEVQDGPGYFVPVTLIDNPPDDARCVVEEAFGPVLPVLKYHRIDEVITRANASNYGLASSVWGRDEQAAADVGRRLEAGVVWINCIHQMSPAIPMGGVKQSGLGVENGPEGLAHYCNLQTIVQRAT